jgi:alkanesulfonate monooxygenase SsuD/methylene tetrahydromethanopterin reductase-like flavin-dependent oxidoreductase (luciferase family)
MPARAAASASSNWRAENLTVRQLAQRLGGYGGLAFVGTPQTIADEMEEWLETEGSDGFNIMFPYLPPGSTILSRRSCPNCSGAGSSGDSMRDRHPARESRPEAAAQPVFRISFRT